MGVLQTFVFLLVIRSLDLFQREPIGALIGLVLWGSFIATAFAGQLNTLVQRSLPGDIATVFGSTIAAPLVEEFLKGLGLLLAFFASAWAFKRLGFLGLDGVTDGLVYGAAVGLGFALWENLQYLFLYADRNGVSFGMKVFLVRSDFAGLGSLGHAVYTGCFGAGLGLATWSSRRIARVGFPLIGLAAGMLLHAVHNGYVGAMVTREFGLETAAATFSGRATSEVSAEVERVASHADRAVIAFDYLCVGLFLAAIWLWLRYQRRVLDAKLSEEEAMGLIAPDERRLLTHYLARVAAHWRLIAAGRLDQWHLVRQLHQDLTDLAFLKWRLERCGGDLRQLDRYRRRVSVVRSLLDTSGKGEHFDQPNVVLLSALVVADSKEWPIGHAEAPR